VTTQAIIRQQVRRKRARLTAEEKVHAARWAIHHLKRNAAFRRSRTVACYLPANNEIDCTELIDAIWAMNKSCYLPVLAPTGGNHLWFASFDPDTVLISNRYGIFEPQTRHRACINPRAIDLILMPLVAFDPNGNRIGMGGGYYDRTLAFLLSRNHWRKPRLFGMAYACQQVDSIPDNPWDVPMDGIVTENGIQFPGKS
jgi:5-formyltetrahydrofolate cyclo-ligase